MIITETEWHILTVTSAGDPLPWTPEIGTAWDDLLARGLVNDAGGITDEGLDLLAEDPPPCSGPCSNTSPCDRCTCEAERANERFVERNYHR